MNRIFKSFIFLIALSFIQCDNDDALDFCPDAENTDWFKELKNQYPANGDIKVECYSYSYNGKVVIAVNTVSPTCCDFMDVVYDCGGNVICQFGGIAGLNTCPDFIDAATDKKLIFKN